MTSRRGVGGSTKTRFKAGTHGWTARGRRRGRSSRPATPAPVYRSNARRMSCASGGWRVHQPLGASARFACSTHSASLRQLVPTTWVRTHVDPSNALEPRFVGLATRRDRRPARRRLPAQGSASGRPCACARCDQRERGLPTARRRRYHPRSARRRRVRDGDAHRAWRVRYSFGVNMSSRSKSSSSRAGCVLVAGSA